VSPITLHGKKIYEHDGGLPCTEAKFFEAVNGLNLLETLRYLSKITISLKDNPSAQHKFYSKGISVSIILDFIRKIIGILEWNNTLSFNPKDVDRALHMYVYLDEENSSLTPEEQYMAISYQQFSYNIDMAIELGRTLCLYAEIWSSVAQPKAIDIIKSIEQITGLRLDAAICLCLGFMQRVNEKGFFRKYQADKLDSLKISGETFLNSDNQDAFIQ